MIDTNELRGYIAKKGTSQRQLAKKMGITEKTFYSKMGSGIFKSNEIDNIVSELGMTREEAINIFFAKEDT